MVHNESHEINIGDRVRRGNINAFRYNQEVSGIVVLKTSDGRNYIKWYEKASNGQQHSTIQSKFLIKINE